MKEGETDGVRAARTSCSPAVALGVGMLAAFIPAWRAGLTDPVMALREQEEAFRLVSRHPHFARVQTLLAVTNDDSRILPNRKLAEDRLHAPEHVFSV